MAKPYNIGMIGYGFMGRAHSNAYNRVSNFFDLEYHPVLKVACGRTEENAKAFADRWGYAETETDWRKLVTAKAQGTQRKREKTFAFSLGALRL